MKDFAGGIGKVRSRSIRGGLSGLFVEVPGIWLPAEQQLPRVEIEEEEEDADGLPVLMRARIRFRLRIMPYGGGTETVIKTGLTVANPYLFIEDRGGGVRKLWYRDEHLVVCDLDGSSEQVVKENIGNGAFYVVKNPGL